MSKLARSVTDLAAKKVGATRKLVQNINRAFVEGDDAHGATIKPAFADVCDSSSASEDGSLRSKTAKALPMEGLRSRLYPIAVITIAMLASIIMFSLWFSDYKATGNIVNVVNDSRTSIQVLVQIVSQVLGMLWVAAFRTVILYFSRIQLAKRPMTMKTLRILNAVTSGPRTDKNLPLIGFILSVLPFLLSLIPGVLWAGALTPNITSINQNFTLLTPMTGNNSYPVAQRIIKKEDGDFWLQELPNGTFLTYPVHYNSAAFLRGIATANSPDGSAVNHTRLFDNTNYQFRGRSYGIGSSPGLVDVDATHQNGILNYTYSELGYMPQAHCYYNESSKFYIHKVAGVSGEIKGKPRFPNEYVVGGHFPDQSMDDRHVRWVQVSYKDNSKLLALGTHNHLSTDPDTRYYAAFATGTDWEVFNKIQCELTFKPTKFNVQVERTRNFIEVTPKDIDSDKVPDQDPTGFLRDLVVMNMMLMSRTQTTLWGSSMGGAFGENLYRLQTYRNETITPWGKAHGQKANNATVLAAVENSLMAYMDDILVTFGETSLYLNDTQGLTATGVKPAVRIGGKPYIVAVFAINVATWLAVICVMIFSRFFWGIPKFDFTDLGCVAVASTIGGQRREANNDATSNSEKQGLLSENYDGNPRCKEADELLVYLEHFPDTKQVGLVLR